MVDTAGLAVLPEFSHQAQSSVPSLLAHTTVEDLSGDVRDRVRTFMHVYTSAKLRKKCVYGQTVDDFPNQLSCVSSE